MKNNIIIEGDCIEEMKKLTENSVDAIVTDPPYGLGFMNKEWDSPAKHRELVEREKKRCEERKAEGKSPTDAPFSQNVQPGLAIKGGKENIWFQKWSEKWSIEAFRVLKPGGYMLVCCATRMYHRMTCGIEDAGFEIRDTIMWLYGSGFPKSLNIGKQIDKMAEKDVKVIEAKQELGKWLKERRGNKPQKEISKHFLSKTGGLTGCVANWELGLNIPTWEVWIKLKEILDLDKRFDYLIEGRPKDYIPAEREVIGKNDYTIPKELYQVGKDKKGERDESLITAPATQEAKEWEGWGTALKPAVEPIVVARKPLSEKNVALNVLKWGTGGINIDECRIHTATEEQDKMIRNKGNYNSSGHELDFVKTINYNPNTQGRFPANIILDEEAGKMLDEQSGLVGNGHWSKTKVTGFGKFGNGKSEYFGVGEKDKTKAGASRFFYCAKASKSERNFGCEDMENKTTDDGREIVSDRPYQRGASQRKNNHPTVKPIALMEYLVKLVSKEGAVILDPFLGSGTTPIACLKLSRKFIGIEKEEEYIKIATARIKPFMEQRKL